MIQYLILAVGILLVLSTIDVAAIGRFFINLFRKIANSVKNVAEHIPTPHIPTIDIPAKNNDTQEHGLVELVQQWESLKKSCLDNGLTDAASKLDEIFPTLIKPSKQEEKVQS